MEKRDDFVIPEEMAEWIDQKKSEYLSKIIQNMVSDDFGFEEFHEFNHLAEKTIEGPDKVFESLEDKETIRTYVRSYTERGGFHQVVRGVLLSDKENQAQILVPIIVFVSRKNELVNLFCEGEVISRPQLN